MIKVRQLVGLELNIISVNPKLVTMIAPEGCRQVHITPDKTQNVEVCRVHFMGGSNVQVAADFAKLVVQVKNGAVDVEAE